VANRNAWDALFILRVRPTGPKKPAQAPTIRSQALRL
ncbi:MAG: hypothetical protein RL749_785, partial [Verrucomicrobiota bacterium]